MATLFNSDVWLISVKTNGTSLQDYTNLTLPEEIPSGSLTYLAIQAIFQKQGRNVFVVSWMNSSQEGVSLSLVSPPSIPTEPEVEKVIDFKDLPAWTTHRYPLYEWQMIPNDLEA